MVGSTARPSAGLSLCPPLDHMSWKMHPLVTEGDVVVQTGTALTPFMAVSVRSSNVFSEWPL